MLAPRISFVSVLTTALKAPRRSSVYVATRHCCNRDFLNSVWEVFKSAALAFSQTNFVESAGVIKHGVWYIETVFKCVAAISSKVAVNNTEVIK